MISSWILGIRVYGAVLFLVLLPLQTVAANDFNEEFISIPAGATTYQRVKSTIGSRTGDEDAKFQIAVAAFDMAKYELTVRQYGEFVAATKHKTGAETGPTRAMTVVVRDGVLKYANNGDVWNQVGFERTENHPVTCLSFFDVSAYCDWRTNHDPKFQYRLPTAAEWQYAAGVAKNKLYDFPEGKVADYANLQDKTLAKLGEGVTELSFDDAFAYTAPVDAKQPSVSGCVFLHGNVAEMTTSVPEANPELCEDYMILCGGHWMSTVKEAGSTEQIYWHKVAASTLTGFRLVRVPKESIER